jgi:hypothetical protein
MNDRFTTQSLKGLFKYPCQGQGCGRKLFLLGLFYLAGWIIPLVPWLFSMGYSAEILRRAAQDEAGEGLPEWADWNRLLMDGLRMLGASLIGSLPFIVLGFVGMTYSLGSMLVSVAMAGRNDWSSFLFMVGQMGGMAVFFTVVGLALVCSLVVLLIAPAAVTHMVREGKFVALFRVGSWWPVFRANLGGYLVAFFIIFGLGCVLQLVTQLLVFSMVLCAVVPLLWLASTSYLAVISSLVYGQAYLEGAQRVAYAAER